MLNIRYALPSSNNEVKECDEKKGVMKQSKPVKSDLGGNQNNSLRLDTTRLTPQDESLTPTTALFNTPMTAYYEYIQTSPSKRMQKLQEEEEIILYKGRESSSKK